MNQSKPEHMNDSVHIWVQLDIDLRVCSALCDALDNSSMGVCRDHYSLECMDHYSQLCLVRKCNYREGSMNWKAKTIVISVIGVT